MTTGRANARPAHLDRGCGAVEVAAEASTGVAAASGKAVVAARAGIRHDVHNLKQFD